MDGWRNRAHLYALLLFTYEIAVEALAELKHTRSVRQGPRDVERLTA